MFVCLSVLPLGKLTKDLRGFSCGEIAVERFAVVGEGFNLDVSLTAACKRRDRRTQNMGVAAL